MDEDKTFCGELLNHIVKRVLVYVYIFVCLFVYGQGTQLLHAVKRAHMSAAGATHASHSEAA